MPDFFVAGIVRGWSIAPAALAKTGDLWYNKTNY